MFRWLLDNTSSLILALILAIFVWFVAVQETNPIVEQLYEEPIPVVMLNQPSNSVLTNDPKDTIEVTVYGPRQTLAALQPDDFDAVIDLSAVSLGGAEVPVAVTVDNPLVRIVQQDVDSIFVQLEEFRRITLPITPTVIGVPALGHVSGDPLVEPAVVTLEGPASKVDPVVGAWVQVSIKDDQETVQGSVTVRLRDANGRLVSGIEPDPPDVLITVPITKSDEYAELFVTVNLTGTIATGYRLADYSVDPQRITIFGPPAVVSALPGFISTVPVDVSGADADLIQRVGLQAPEGVTLIGDQSVVVEIDIEPVVTTLTVPWRPQILGPDPGLTATISPERVDVLLAGPLALIEAFDPETDLSLTLNLYGMVIGSYQLEPAALSNVLGVEVERVLPSTVSVEIYLLPTPTPTLTPTITGTTTITGTPVFVPTIIPVVTPTP